jgi:hypothetical protein
MNVPRSASVLALSLSLLSLCAVHTSSFAQSANASLFQGFENPPSGARPRVWWHWMNGNITKTGITLDLRWMHSVGIAGFQTFDAALATPQVVPHRLVYMTPEWQDAFRYATTLAGQLGMEEAIAGSPGWSETGGPWVPASQGMKKYVWSETVVKGGKPFRGVLLHPPSDTGAFQDVGIHDVISAPKGAKPIPQFYADAAVVAYRRPADDVPMTALHFKVTASEGSPDMAVLTDGDLTKTTAVPIPKAGESAWIQVEFPQPERMRAVTFAMQSIGGGALGPLEPLENARSQRRWNNISYRGRNSRWGFSRVHHRVSRRDREVFQNCVQADAATTAPVMGKEHGSENPWNCDESGTEAV